MFRIFALLYFYLQNFTKTRRGRSNGNWNERICVGCWWFNTRLYSSWWSCYRYCSLFISSQLFSLNCAQILFMIFFFSKLNIKIYIWISEFLYIFSYFCLFYRTINSSSTAMCSCSLLSNVTPSKSTSKLHFIYFLLFVMFLQYLFQQ